jgi:hypothetical protein
MSPKHDYAGEAGFKPQPEGKYIPRDFFKFRTANTENENPKNTKALREEGLL